MAQSTGNAVKMSLTALPNDCLLACLARVPCADLRNGLPSTCKSLRDAVASSAFRKTREAAGYVEWAVFARGWESDSFLIQASGAYRAAPGPTVGQDWHLARLSSGRGDEVVLIQTFPGEMRADAYHPLQNRWRELAPPFSRHSGWTLSDGINQEVTCRGLGSTIMVIGGTAEASIDVYDASQDTWSRRPHFPFFDLLNGYLKAVEVDGKLWLYALEYHLQETFVYDPATQTWTAGPRLPHELYDEGGVLPYYQAFEWRKRFCLMACFKLDPEDVSYLGFMWDPIRGAWDEAPFPMPPVIAHDGENIDNNLIVAGNVEPSSYEGPYDRRSRLFVLKPDSSEWDEWRFPDDIDWRKVRSNIAMSAVRLG